MSETPVSQVDQTTWQGNVLLLHKLANKYLRRVEAHSLDLEYDDLFQEASVAYVYARRAFDPSRGLRFTTLLVPCVERHLHKLISKRMQRQMALNSTSLEGLLANYDDPDKLAELGDGAPDASQQVQDQCEANRLLNKLSPLALVAFQMAHLPSEEIKQEYQAWRYKRQAQGAVGALSKDVSLNFVCRHLLPRLYPSEKSNARRIEVEISYVIGRGDWG